jgi:hypothetical protein
MLKKGAARASSVPPSSLSLSNCRLTTVIAADAILVLDHGQIVARGTHRVLLAPGRHLRPHMWARQQEAAEAERLIQDAKDDGAVKTAE